MQPRDYIYSQAYKGALRQGATERAAHNSALMCMDSFKKNKFRKGGAGALIQKHIREAVQSSKKH